MLKKLLSGAGTLTAALWMAGTVHAVSLTFTDVVDPNPDIFLSRSASTGFNLQYTYTHDILDNGFNPLSHVLSDVYLTMHVEDENPSPDTSRERVKVYLDDVDYGTFDAKYADLFFTVDVNLMKDDGQLKVTLVRDKGDFLFTKATLMAEATGPDHQAAAAPEPSTLILLGSGLAGMIGLGRRRRQKAASS